MTLGCFAGMEGFDCSLLWIIMILIFFLSAIARKQINDFGGMDFTLIGSTIAGELSFFIVMLITKSMKWSFLVAIISLLAGGFFLTSFFPDGESGDSGGEGWY